jgi:hypothetical protein
VTDDLAPLRAACQQAIAHIHKGIQRKPAKASKKYRKT